MIVWKHHIAEDFENNGVPVFGNGVGIGGTVFKDFNKMLEWLNKNDKRRFYVAPIYVNEKDITFFKNNDLMAKSEKSVKSVGPFASIEYWQKIM